MENTHLFNTIMEESRANVPELQSLTIEELLQGFDRLMIDIDYMYDKFQLDKLFRCIQSVFHEGSKNRVEMPSNKLTVDLFHKIKESLDDSNEDKKNERGIMNQRSKLKGMLKNLHSFLNTHWTLYNMDDPQLIATLKDVYKRFEAYTTGPEDRGGSVFTRTRQEVIVHPMLSEIQYELSKTVRQVDPFERPSNDLSNKIRHTLIKLYEKVKGFTDKFSVSGSTLVSPLMDDDLMVLQQNQGMFEFRINATTYLFMFQKIMYSLTHMFVNTVLEMIRNLKAIGSGSLQLTTAIGKVVLLNEIMTAHNDRIDIRNPMIHKLRNVISSLLQTTKRVSQDVSSQKGQISRFARESGVDQPRTNIQYTQATMPIEVESVKSGSYESSLSSGSIDENFLRDVLGDLDSDIDVNEVINDVGHIRAERVSRVKKPDEKIRTYREPTADDLSVAISNQYGIQSIRPVEPHMDYPHLRTYVEINGPNGVKQRGYVIGEADGKYVIGLDGYRAKVKLFDIYKILFFTPRGLGSVEIQGDLLEYVDIRDSKLDENKELYERLSNNLRRLTRGNKLLVEVTNSEDHAWRKPLEQPYLPHADGDYYILATIDAPFNYRMLGNFFNHGYWGGQQKLEDLEVLVIYDDKIVELNRSEFTLTQGQHMDMVNRQFNQDRDDFIQNVYRAIEHPIHIEDQSARNVITELNRDPRFATNADLTMGQLRGLQFESQVPEYERQRAFEQAEGYIGGDSKLKDCCDKNIKTRRKCRRKDGKTFKLPRKQSRDKCLSSKKKKGFSMKSSCAPYKYCNQLGGGLVYSTLPYHLSSYISDDWSKSSDSNKKIMFLDPHRRLFKDSGPDGAGQWYLKYGNEHKNYDYIIQGEQETCRLPHKGNRKKLNKWMNDRKMTKTKYVKENKIKDDEIYRNVTTKDDLFDFYKCKNDDEYLDIQCDNGKLTNTKCVRSTKRGGGKTKKKNKKESDLTLKKSKGRKKQSKAKRKKALEKAIQYKLAEMVIEDRRKEWIPEPPIYAEQLSTTESFHGDELNYEDYLNGVSFNPEQRRQALEGVKRKDKQLDDLEDMFRDIRLNRRNQNFLEIQEQLDKLNIK